MNVLFRRTDESRIKTKANGTNESLETVADFLTFQKNTLIFYFDSNNEFVFLFSNEMNVFENQNEYVYDLEN